MPTVVSKYLQDAAAKYPALNQPLAKKVAGVALLAVAIK